MNITAETCNVTDELSVRVRALTGPGQFFFAVDIRLAAGCNFILIFVRHFLFVHVRCLTLFSAWHTRLDMETQPKCFQVGDTFSSYKEFKEHLEEFELLHRESRTLSAAALVKQLGLIIDRAS